MKKYYFIVILIILSVSTLLMINFGKAELSGEWVGNYSFSEFAEPNQSMSFYIEVYEVTSGKMKAKININGFQTLTRISANVIENSNSIELIFDKYLPENIFEPYSKGDLLLTFKKNNSELETYWGAIQPMIVNYPETKTDYFEFVE